MRDARIWKAAVWLLMAVGLLLIFAQCDRGVFNLFTPAGVIPVSTGQGMAIVSTSVSALRGEQSARLSLVEPDGKMKTAQEFNQGAQCVTGFDGNVFITFADGASSIFKDGQWLRSVSAPEGMDITDVTGFQGTVYAFGLSEDERRIAVRMLGDEGWSEPAAPFDAAKRIVFAGCIDVGDLIYVYYGAPKSDAKSLTGIDDWYYTTFDGTKWGVKTRLDLPADAISSIASYRGELAFVITRGKKDVPVEIGLVKDGRLDVAAQVPTAGLGRIISGWLVAVGGTEHLVLSGAAKSWDVPLEDLKPGTARLLVSQSGSSRLRGDAYVGALALAAVLLVSLGFVWFLIRLRRLGRGGKGQSS